MPGKNLTVDMKQTERSRAIMIFFPHGFYWK